MRGHIHKRQHERKDGRTSVSYYAVIFRGHDAVTGKKQYDWERGFKTKREAETALVERLAALGAGTYVAPADTTVERACTPVSTRATFHHSHDTEAGRTRPSAPRRSRTCTE